MRRSLFLGVFSLVLSIDSFAQGTHVHGPWCGVNQEQERIFEKYPETRQSFLALEKAFEQKLLQKSSSDEILTIPLVFHVLQNGGPENISDEQIFDAMNILNNEFRKNSADSIFVIPEFRDIHADTRIQFRLANRGPDGSCSNGINRLATSFIDDDRNGAVKFFSWPRHVYLNVWVVNSIASGEAGTTTTLGYATLPAGVDSPELAGQDGIVVWNRALGTIGLGQPIHATTLTHEVGHILNLFHTWGNGPIQTDCGDDGVEDTPFTEGRFGCPSPFEAMICEQGVVENYQNYMDYSSCAFMFTQGQAERMRTTLSMTTAGRSFLVTPDAHAIAGIDQDPPIVCSPSVNFRPARFYACVGQAVQFNPFIEKASVDSYAWSFDDADIASSSLPSPSVSFNSPGWKTVTLTAGNASGSDTRTNEFAIYIYGDGEQIVGDVYQENFHNDAMVNNGWTIMPANQNILANGINWEWSPIGSLDGGSLKANLFDGIRPETYTFVTPRLNLEGRGGQKLSFRFAYATQGTPSETNISLKVSSTSNCGGSIIERLLISEPQQIITGGSSPGVSFEPNGPLLWRTAELLISQGQAVSGAQYEFTLSADFGVNNFYIDNVTIGNTVVSAEDEGPIGVTRIFPNPAKDYAQLELALNQPELVTIRVFNITGQQVNVIQAQQLPAGTNNVRIDTNGLAAGVYTVKISADGFDRSLKLMVQP